MKTFFLSLILVALVGSCAKKFYITSAGGERPLPERGDMFNIECAANSRVLPDTNHYYREYAITGPEMEETYYRYVRFLDGCRLMKNSSMSTDSTFYTKLEDAEAESIGKYAIDPSTRNIVIKTFSSGKWGIILTSYGTISGRGDTIHITKLVIPHVSSFYRYYLVKTDIPVKNRLRGSW